MEESAALHVRQVHGIQIAVERAHGRASGGVMERNGSWASLALASHLLLLAASPSSAAAEPGRISHRF